jgi:hypothetical protein
MSLIKHIWCSFCEDRPAVGRMVVMIDRSRHKVQDVIGDDGAACDLHGRAWTGVPIASKEETGEYAVLQYVHPDFIKVTEEHIQAFAVEKTCSECGDPTDPLPLWAAERILMANPHLVLEQEFRWEGICIDCAHKNNCPHCAEKDGEDDGDDETDGPSSTHPYCH